MGTPLPLDPSITGTLQPLDPSITDTSPFRRLSKEHPPSRSLNKGPPPEPPSRTASETPGPHQGALLTLSSTQHPSSAAVSLLPPPPSARSPQPPPPFPHLPHAHLGAGLAAATGQRGPRRETAQVQLLLQGRHDGERDTNTQRHPANTPLRIVSAAAANPRSAPLRPTGSSLLCTAGPPGPPPVAFWEV